MNQPLILISNDDSIHALGLHRLVSAIRHLAHLVVVAPDRPRSGAAGSLTVNQCITVSHNAEYSTEGVTFYACSGTPTDCIKVALHDKRIVPQQPVMVIGGINHGDNSAVNVHYSGTLGVVLEGCMKGIPSVGFSLCDHNPQADFAPMLPFVVKIVEHVLAHPLPQGVCLNVNAPAVPDLGGIKVCRQTRGMWQKEFDVRIDAVTGATSYWLTGNFVANDTGTDCDHWALTHHFVAVTPVKIDVTDYDLLHTLSF